MERKSYLDRICAGGAKNSKGVHFLFKGVQIDKFEFVYLFLTKRVIPLTSIDIITHTHSTGDIVGITSNKVPQDSLATLLAPSL